MTKYVCIGCGFENNDDKMSGEPCPYCGEYMLGRGEGVTQNQSRDVDSVQTS